VRIFNSMAKVEGRRTLKNLQKMIHILRKCLLTAGGSRAGRPAVSRAHCLLGAVQWATRRTAAYMPAQGVSTSLLVISALAYIHCRTLITMETRNLS